MANPETKAQYEGAILNQFIKNAERLAVVEKDIEGINEELQDVKRLIKTTRGWLITIFVGIIINIFSQPIVRTLCR